MVCYLHTKYMLIKVNQFYFCLHDLDNLNKANYLEFHHDGLEQKMEYLPFLKENPISTGDVLALKSMKCY